MPAPPPRWRARALSTALAFVAIVLVVDSLIGNKGLMDTIRARRQFTEVAADLGKKRRENARLRQEIQRLRDDPAAIESLAREELGLMRDDEVLFIVHDARPDAR